MKINRIIGSPARGKFKDKQIEVQFGESSEDTHVKVNGKELKMVQFVGVKCRAGELTKIVIEKIAEKQ